MYFTYILYSEKNSRYYIGHCENLPARLLRQNCGAVISTKKYMPWRIVYSETFDGRAAANNRELYIKKQKSRKYIEKLIGGGTGKHIPI
jgi:putative endonuclease